MYKKTSFKLTLIALTLFSSNAFSQSAETGFFSKADATLSSDDNIYRVFDSIAQSDTFLNVTPEVKIVGGLGKHRFNLEYIGDFAKYSDISKADFSDHDIRGRIDFSHTISLSTRFEAGFQKEHEDAGSVDRIQLNLTEYNKYTQNFMLAGLSYGQETSVGRVALNYRRMDKDYSNNDLDYLDFIEDQYSLIFTYRIAPKTKVYAEAIVSSMDYTPATNFELDNTYKRYRAGIVWDFTNKLSGDIGIGYQDRDYDLATLRDINGLAYDGNVTWSINTYTTLALVAKRESVDSSLEESGGFLRTSYGLGLQHNLTELLKLTGDAGVSKDALVFSSAREDKRYAYQLGIEYSIQRYLTLSAQYTYEERNSTNVLADFKANIFSVTASFKMDN